MPQEFFIGRCCSCQKFQVLQVRKDKKFSCKICGVKQSVKKVYFAGDAKACRKEVMLLNSLEGYTTTSFRDGSITQENSEYNSGQCNYDEEKKPEIMQSKWSKFIDNNCDTEEFFNTDKGMSGLNIPTPSSGVKRKFNYFTEEVKSTSDEISIVKKLSPDAKRISYSSEEKSNDHAIKLVNNYHKLKIYEKYKMLDDLDFTI